MATKFEDYYITVAAGITVTMVFKLLLMLKILFKFRELKDCVHGIGVLVKDSNRKIESLSECLSDS